MDWTTAASIKQQLQRYWSRGQMLTDRPDSKPLFPLSLRFRKPDAKALSDHFDEVRRWIRDLEEGSKAKQGFGYQIEWAGINHRQLGHNRVPAGVSVPTEYDAFRLLNKTQEANRFRTLADASSQRFPLLSNWLARRPLTVLEHADDWKQILTVLDWFHEHPRSGLYLRQLDIAGVDTKFIEARKGLLSELLDEILPPEMVNAQFTGAKNFEGRYGLASKPPLIRFRLLDRRLNLHGLSDLSVPAAQFAQLNLPVDRVFITENEVNGLAFPETPGSMVIFGLGYGVQTLADVDWLQNKKLHYWGDIDTHGFAILNRFRTIFHQAQSFLMDRETLLAHREMWVMETERFLGVLTRLTDSEQSLLTDLQQNILGEQVRLEQERISFHWLQQVLQALIWS
jgi:hypothetical protein